MQAIPARSRKRTENCLLTGGPRLCYDSGNVTGIVFGAGTLDASHFHPSRSGAATPTIRDVAALAGVSVTTVSRVLNAKGDVAPETAERVQRVIDELHYESSLAARSLRSRRKQVIGLIVPDMDHSYGVEIIRAAGRAIVGTSYDLIAMTTGTTDLAERARWQKQQVSRINGTVTDGVVVVVPGAPEFRTNHPLVVVDPYRAGHTYPSVVADNYGGALEAMRYLIGLGHRRIAHISGYDFLEASVERRRAYCDALAEAGIDVSDSLVRQSDFARPGGAAALRHFLSLDPPPTAIFAGNDECALGVIEEALRQGLKVPGDLSVVGFDNVFEAANAHPALTTVDQGLGETIRTAFAILIDLIDGKSLPETRVTLPARLIIRESCAPPPGGH